MTKKTLRDCQVEAVILHGISQGMEKLDHLASGEPQSCAASNALTSLNVVLTERLGQLADDLDALETEARQ